MLVLHFHAGSSRARCIGPSGITLAIMSGTCSYGAERGPWRCDTAGAAPQTLVTTGHGSWDRRGQHTSGEGKEQRGCCSLYCSLSDLSNISLQVDVTCMLRVVRAGQLGLGEGERLSALLNSIFRTAASCRACVCWLSVWGAHWKEENTSLN